MIEQLKAFPLIYLATPYSRYLGGPHCAFIDAAQLAAKLIILGLPIYSPIVHTHPIAFYGKLDLLNHRLWLAFDQAMISASSALLIGKLEGWDNSYGISEEESQFFAAGKPVFFVNPETMEVTS